MAQNQTPQKAGKDRKQIHDLLNEISKMYKSQFTVIRSKFSLKTSVVTVDSRTAHRFRSKHNLPHPGSMMQDYPEVRGNFAIRISRTHLEVAGERVRSFRVSCTSDKYSRDGDFAGIVVWKSCPEMEEGCGRRIKPGYIYIKDTEGDLPTCSEGRVHGSVVKDFCGLDPKKLSATAASSQGSLS